MVNIVEKQYVGVEDVGVFDTFSKRVKRETQSNIDVYQYDIIPDPLRIQVIHIWDEAIGPFYSPGPYDFRTVDYIGNKAWPYIQKTLSKEYGIFRLTDDEEPDVNCKKFILKASTGQALDIIELSFKVINTYIREISIYKKRESHIIESSDGAIEELNHRFREHKVGYQFENNQLVKVDSEYIHEFAMKPAITLLHDNNFQGAEEEFMTAHEHFRNGRHKEAIQEANKSFESVMKTICDLRGWKYTEKATAVPLVQILFDNEIIPPYLQQEFSSLINILKAGLPPVRNRFGGHGQGADTIQVPEYLATYALHLAATNIVFLINANNEK